MTQNLRYAGLESAFYLFDAMVKDKLGYIYRGQFDDDIADNILELTENSIQAQEESSKIKKRVYAIMVEGLQNITRHQNVSSESTTEHKSIFVLQKIEDKYYITTGNIIENKNIEKLKQLITKINSLDKDELKLYYKQILEEGSLSNKGGAGLGLIDMARKSGNNLAYHFRKLDNDLSYFYLHTIPTLNNGDVEIIDGSTQSLDTIVEIHQALKKENVTQIFNGIFNEDSLESTLASLQKNISVSKQYEQIFTTLLENIVKYGVKTSDDMLGNPGMFYMSESGGKQCITTGNYILAEQAEAIIETFDEVNGLVAKGTEVQGGLFEVRKITGSMIEYAISDVDDQFKFLSVKVCI